MSTLEMEGPLTGGDDFEEEHVDEQVEEAERAAEETVVPDSAETVIIEQPKPAKKVEKSSTAKEIEALKASKPTPVGELYAGLVNQAKVFNEKDFETQKGAAKGAMKERAALLKEYNRPIYDKVLRLRKVAEDIKKGKTKGNYSNAVRQAVDLFNKGYEKAKLSEEQIQEDTAPTQVPSEMVAEEVSVVEEEPKKGNSAVGQEIIDAVAEHKKKGFVPGESGDQVSIHDDEDASVADSRAGSSYDRLPPGFTFEDEDLEGAAKKWLKAVGRRIGGWFKKSAE